MGKERERRRSGIYEDRERLRGQQHDPHISSRAVATNVSHIETPSPSPAPPSSRGGGDGGELSGAGRRLGMAGDGNDGMGVGLGRFSAVETAELEARLAALERTWNAVIREQCAGMSEDRLSEVHAWSVACSNASLRQTAQPSVHSLQVHSLAQMHESVDSRLASSSSRHDLYTTPTLAVACKVQDVATSLDSKGRAFTIYRIMVLLAHGGTLQTCLLDQHDSAFTHTHTRCSFFVLLQCSKIVCSDL